MVMTRSMRRKSKTLEIPDMISSLPDGLLTHILSFLSTKESVSTSILSTRWRYLFTFVPVLDFHLPRAHPKPEEFVIFVDRVLSLHDVSCTMRKFRIAMPQLCNDSDIGSWITVAICRNAQIIDVELPRYTSTYLLPNDLFTCQVLVDLKMCGGFVFDVTGLVSLPSLKTVNFSYCNFSNRDSAERFFSSCPMLEDLRLKRCNTCDGSVISISALLLKRLTIFNVFGECEWELNNVPNLETIDLSNYGQTRKCYSVNILKSLRRASIKVINVYGGVDGGVDNKIGQLINKFEEVQFLSLSGYWMESLGRDSFSLPPMFNKLTTLNLIVKFSHGWKYLPILLERSSCLELLTIAGAGFVNCDQEYLEMDILLPERVPLCFSRSLKEVRLNMFKGRRFEYDWLGYLLKNAKVLEKLVVTASLVDEGNKLLTLPRESKNCQIVVTRSLRF